MNCQSRCKRLSGCIGNVRYVRCVGTMIYGTVRWYGTVVRWYGTVVQCVGTRICWYGTVVRYGGAVCWYDDMWYGTVVRYGGAVVRYGGAVCWCDGMLVRYGGTMEVVRLNDGKVVLIEM